MNRVQDQIDQLLADFAYNYENSDEDEKLEFLIEYKQALYDTLTLNARNISPYDSPPAVYKHELAEFLKAEERL